MSVKKTAEKLGTTAEPEEEVNTNATQEEARRRQPTGQGPGMEPPTDPQRDRITDGGADQGDNVLLAAIVAKLERGD